MLDKKLFESKKWNEKIEKILDKSQVQFNIVFNLDKFKECFQIFENHVEYEDVLSILEPLSDYLINQFFMATNELKGQSIAFF